MQSSRQYLLIWSREEQVSYIAIDCNQLGYQQWEFFRKSMTKTLQLYSKLINNSNTSGFKDADLPVVFVFCFEQVSLTMCWQIPEFSLPGRWKRVPFISRKFLIPPPPPVKTLPPVDSSQQRLIFIPLNNNLHVIIQ